MYSHFTQKPRGEKIESSGFEVMIVVNDLLFENSKKREE